MFLLRIFISEITAGDIQYKVMNELARIQPSEILVNESLQLIPIFCILLRAGFSYITPWQEWAYQKSMLIVCRWSISKYKHLSLSDARICIRHMCSRRLTGIFI